MKKKCIGIGIILFLLLFLVSVSASYSIDGRINIDTIYAGNVDNEFYYYITNCDTEKTYHLAITTEREYFLPNKQVKFPEDEKEHWLPIYGKYKGEWQAVHWMTIQTKEVTLLPQHRIKILLTINTNKNKKGTYFADIETREISNGKGTVSIAIAYTTHVTGVVEPYTTNHTPNSSGLQKTVETQTPGFGFVSLLLCVFVVWVWETKKFL